MSCKTSHLFLGNASFSTGIVSFSVGNASSFPLRNASSLTQNALFHASNSSFSTGSNSLLRCFTIQTLRTFFTRNSSFPRCLSDFAPMYLCSLDASAPLSYTHSTLQTSRSQPGTSHFFMVMLYVLLAMPHLQLET